MLNETQKALLDDYIHMQEKHLTDALFEIAVQGSKQTHWCWYFLPNVPGLGSSERSQHYAIDLPTYIAFLDNQKFRRNVFLMLTSIHRAFRDREDLDLEYVLGNNPVDVLKWKSFLTLTHFAYFNIPNLHPDWDEVDRIVRYAIDFYGLCDKTVQHCRRCNLHF